MILVQKNIKNLLNQIEIANQLANTLNMDLITLPINKSIFKKKYKLME